MLIAISDTLLDLIHDIVIEIEGTPGYMNKGMIKGCIEWSLTYVYGYEPFPHPIMKAAALIYSIIVFHPFIDGNKRTALLGAYYFLWFNGYKFNIPEDSVEFTIKIAKFKKQIPEIAKWIKKNSRRSIRATWTNKVLSFSFSIAPRHPILALFISMLGFQAPSPEYIRQVYR